MNAGKLGRIRGQEAEMLVLYALQLASRPNWIVSVRPSDRQEDERGIDVIVETIDVGQLHLQVKSSRREARKFKREAKKNPFKANRQSIAIVVVNKKDRLKNRLENVLLKATLALNEKRKLKGNV